MTSLACCRADVGIGAPQLSGEGYGSGRLRCVSTQTNKLDGQQSARRCEQRRRKSKRIKLGSFSVWAEGGGGGGGVWDSMRNIWALHGRPACYFPSIRFSVPAPAAFLPAPRPFVVPLFLSVWLLSIRASPQTALPAGSDVPLTESTGLCGGTEEEEERGPGCQRTG